MVAAALLIMLLAYGSRFAFGVFFKPMATEFDWTRALTSGSFTLSMVMQGVWGIFMGRFNDRFGPRFIMTLCCFFLGLGYLLMSGLNTIWQIYLLYGILIGVGMGGVFIALLSTVARWFVKRRSLMTGVVISGMGIGQFVALPVTSLLIATYAWRMSYIIMGAVVLIIGISAAQFLRRDPTKMGLLPYGHNEVKKREVASRTEGFSLKQAVYTRQFWMLSIIYFCFGYIVFTINVHLVPHITDLRISATTAANILAIAGGMRIISGILLGGLADRIGNRWVLTISLILVSAAMFWLLPITEVWALCLFTVIMGLGVGGGGVMESTVVAELFGMKTHGAILGVVSCIFTIGGAIGPFMAGYLFDVIGNYHLAFLISASLGVIALILTATLRSVSSRM